MVLMQETVKFSTEKGERGSMRWAWACVVLCCASSCAADAQRRLLASNFDVAAARTIATGIASGQLVGIDWNSDGANDVAVISSNKLMVYTSASSGTVWSATTLETLTLGSVYTHIAAANMVSTRMQQQQTRCDIFPAAAPQAICISQLCSVYSRIDQVQLCNAYTLQLHCQQQDGNAGTEILTADGANQRIRIYYASGTMETACTGFSAIERIVPADLNGDGLMDIVVADSTLGEQKSVITLQNAVYVASNMS
jgi:hypothetical protein